ncbi:polymeric immunoglobulin receptor-like [Amphibalanus amphitrite]|uniref:polymeric immunoglobulin receptor-like n=1 Tax=Amphibalanus amphitrite TaxID=1232801 RepID=UPI001C908FE3|nr:polymeric immunoglobulin receptor-like [Amphibalanus amphitrite]
MERSHRYERQQVIMSIVFVTFVLNQADADWSQLGGGGFRIEPDPVLKSRRLWESSGGEPAISNVTAQLGGTAFLHCTEPSRPLDRPAEVSWLRRRDWHLLTSGRTRFTHDHRFHIYHDPVVGSWVLKISHVRSRDRGLYECQISTSTGRLAQLVHLHVVQPVADIHGSGVYHVERGSSMSLTCSVKQVVSSSILVVWHHNGKEFNPYTLRPDMKVSVRHSPHKTTSTLSIRDVRLSDGGNYTCTAGTARAASVAVFVSQGDTVAAVQRRKAASSAARGLRPASRAALAVLLACVLMENILR